jgi:hypothetical protein
LRSKSSHAKALVFQLGPNKLNQFATKELHEFDLKDGVAWETFKSS